MASPVITPARLGRLVRPWHTNSGALVGWLFAIPAAVLFGAFAIYPMGRVVYLSFFQYSLFSSPKFDGLANYRYLFADPVAHTAVTNTLVYLVGTYVPTIVLALLIALALNTKMPGAGLLRLLYFLPVVISWVAVAVIWNLVFQPQGLLNQILHINVDWLTSSTWAPVALIIVSIWKELGFFVILFLAGLQRIPKELYEAASTDGAGGWARFRYVTIPQIRPMMLVVTVLAVYRGLAVFSPQFVMTDGGPANSTEVVNLYVYNNAFVYANFGRASAMAALLFAVLIILGLAQFAVYHARGGE
jgi:ABC-type sugar transport system permease subunit